VWRLATTIISEGVIRKKSDFDLLTSGDLDLRSKQTTENGEVFDTFISQTTTQRARHGDGSG